MRFDDVVDFPGEREAYMVVREKIGLSEEEYLKLSYIERRELTQAYRLAKKLGVECQDKLRQGYGYTKMFDENGIYDLSEATMMIKAKAGVLSLARTKLGAKQTVEEFILMGDIETSAVALKVMDAFADDAEKVVEHLRPLVQPMVIDAKKEADKLVVDRAIRHRFEFADVLPSETSVDNFGGSNVYFK